MKMRILHVIDSDGLYGAEIVLLCLMESQKQMGLHPMLLSLGDRAVGPKEIDIEARERGLNVFPLRFQKGLNIKGAFKILELARSLESQIIHSHGYKANILLGILPRKLRRLPVITTLHGWTSTRLFSKIWFYEWLDAFALKNLEEVVAVSSEIQNNARLKIFGIHPAVINNGIPKLNINDGDFQHEFPELSKKLENKFKILWIGRLSPEKGVDVLIRAVSIAVSSSIDPCLVLMGEGEEGPSLRRLAEKEDLTDKVHFTGYCDKAFRFLPYFDVFVLPSYSEGLPITLLEAMQAGTPVIATKVGEIAKILGQGRCGTLVGAGDSVGLAKAIEEVYRDKEEAEAKAAAAKDLVFKEYHVERMANKYLEQYQNLISQNKK